MYYIRTFQNGQLNGENDLKKVNVGVVGAGHLGRFHTLNYARIPEVELVGVTDIDMEKARSLASEVQCEAIENLDDLLDKVEAVSVVVPTHSHFEVGKRVFEQGVHCLMEKPITKTVEQAKELIRLAGAKGKIFQVGHVERFNPAIRVLEDMKIHPRFIESHRLAPFDPRGTEVAVVLDLMIHDIDVILNLVKSPVKHVDASGVAVVSDSIDIANARISFENGCVANMTASRISQKKMRKMRLFQKDTYIAIDFLERSTEIYRLAEGTSGSGISLGEIGAGDKKKQVVLDRPKVPEEGGLQTELEVFIQSVRGHLPQKVSGEEGLSALVVSLEILQQMEG